MPFFSGHITAATTVVAAVFLTLGAASHAAPQPVPVGRDASPARTTRQKPASELISKQAKPKVVPRVLDTATPDNTRIYVSLSKQRAYLLVGDEVAIDSPISSGKRAGMTPKGSFTVMEKDKDHRSNVYGAFCNSRGQIVRAGVSTRIDSAPSGTHYVGAPMLWFMRLTSEGVGMHVGILPGYPASHGCVRMPLDIAPLFYERVKVGTPAVIGD
ncbi:MAG: L,D-transpeptidase family protein [Terrimicrobiaceae bacterium]|nr:L,D-transpeptidase family protein [Terrimicrobiaceae bacterium]